MDTLLRHWWLIPVGAAGSAGLHEWLGHGWWLDSIEGVRAVSGGLFVLALGVNLLRGKATGSVESLSQLGLLWGGVITGLVLSFGARAVSSGPGTIFPLVLAFTAMLSGVLTVAGWGLGAAIRALGSK